MFVRAKPRGEKTFYYLVASQRVGNRVRQKTLAYLGESPTVASAIAELRAAITFAESRAAGRRKQAEAVKAKITPQAYTTAVALTRAAVVDGVPTFLYRGCPREQDYAKQFHIHLREARSDERWARRMKVQLENLQGIDSAV